MYSTMCMTHKFNLNHFFSAVYVGAYKPVTYCILAMQSTLDTYMYTEEAVQDLILYEYGYTYTVSEI
jgi:hypothetical protein